MYFVISIDFPPPTQWEMGAWLQRGRGSSTATKQSQAWKIRQVAKFWKVG